MAVTVFCGDGRQCIHDPEHMVSLTGGGYEPSGGCFNPPEPHSDLCEQHGGVADLEQYQMEWEHYITEPDELCHHITDDEDQWKLDAFINGTLGERND